MFDTDFFLWILINFRNKKFILDNNFRIVRITDLTTRGEGVGTDNIGREISTRSSPNVSRSIPMLLTILSNRHPTNIRIAVVVDNIAGTIKISEDGSLSVIQSLGFLNLVPKMDKIVISLHLIIRFINLYKNWKEMNLILKYPDEDDFLKIQKECKESNYRIYNMGEIIERYKRLRSE